MMVHLRRLLLVLSLLAFSACSSTAVEQTAEVDDATTDDTAVEETADEDVSAVDDTDDEDDELVEDEVETDEDDEQVEDTDDDGVDSSDPSPVIVELLDNGAEPRQELRYTFSEGDETQIIESTQSFEQVVDGVSQGAPNSIATVTEVAITLTPSGDVFEVETEISSANAGESVDPAEAALIEDSLSAIVGLTTLTTVDSRGFVDASSFDGAANELLNALLGDSINQSNPFPEEEVGVGASWQTETVLDEIGVDVVLTTTNTLREFTDTGVIIDISLDQTVEDLGAQVNLGGLEAIVDTWDVNGTGFSEIDFSRLTPVASEVLVEGTQAFTFAGQGSLGQTISAETTISGS